MKISPIIYIALVLGAFGSGYAIVHGLGHLPRHEAIYATETVPMFEGDPIIGGPWGTHRDHIQLLELKVDELQERLQEVIIKVGSSQPAPCVCNRAVGEE